MTLELTYDKLRREIGYFLGYGRDPTKWVDGVDGLNAYRADDVEYVIENGLRRFYWPMLPLQKYKDAQVTYERYVWSFLESTTTLTTVSGVATYDLPAGFTDFLSNGFSYSGGSVARITDEDLSSLDGIQTLAGDPKYFSLRSKAIPATGATVYEVVLYPIPDSAKVLTYKYAVTPPEMSEENPNHLGGAQVSQVVLEACLAQAQKKHDDTVEIDEARFRELLTAAIEVDRKLSKPDVTDPWPLLNASSGLEVNKAYLRRLIGEQLEYGPHQGTWDNTQIQHVKLCLETGLRKFYTPNILPGERNRHNWSFLRPIKSMMLLSGQEVYDLPGDFAMFDGDELLYEDGSSFRHRRIIMVSERQVTKMLKLTNASGIPTHAAYRPKAPQEGVGTVYELLVAPRPNADMEINFRYSINPGALSDETALPFGGQANMQTVIEACLAACEERVGKPGVHSAAFIECLRSSVSQDRKVNSPPSLGTLQDYDVGPYGDSGISRRCSYGTVTYNGISY